MIDLPCALGVGFKPCHFADLLASNGAVQWAEVHAENYLMDGGSMRAQLFELRSHMPISLHGVGLSLGGAQAPDAAHLARLRQLIDELKPAQFSEHLAWSMHGHGAQASFANDLLPVVYSREALARVSDNIDAAQQALGQRILIENPSLYLAAQGCDSAAAETDFLSALVAQSGCGLLVDVNNIFVTCQNLGWRSDDYLHGLPFGAVGEVHLAGHASDVDASGTAVLIDNHGGPVAPEVWALYDDLLRACGPRPSLIEWDTNVPEWSVLNAECAKAEAILASFRDISFRDISFRDTSFRDIKSAPKEAVA